MVRRKVAPTVKIGGDATKLSARKLQQQLAFELLNILERYELTQEQLALKIDKPAASISRWVNMNMPMSAPAAKALDEADLGPTSLGTSFEDLHQTFVRANRKRTDRQMERTATVDTAYDLFLAGPMAASPSQESFREERDSASAIADAFRTKCDFKVYYAGDFIAAEAEFDAPDIALEQNVQALSDASYFVMVILQPLTKPSSVLVEAGFALARRIPSLYFVRAVDYLPYILRQATQHQSDSLPTVTFR